MASHSNFGRTGTSAISDRDKLKRAMTSYFNIFGIRDSQFYNILHQSKIYVNCNEYEYVFQILKYMCRVCLRFSYNPAHTFRFILIGAKIG